MYFHRCPSRVSRRGLCVFIAPIAQSPLQETLLEQSVIPEFTLNKSGLCVTKPGSFNTKLRGLWLTGHFFKCAQFILYWY